MEYKDENGLTTVKGLVIPVDWDDRGNVTAVAVSTFFEDEYLIEQDARGEGLFAFLHQSVKVRGPVRQSAKGKKVITVRKYELLEE